MKHMDIVVNLLQKKYGETPVLNIRELHCKQGTVTGVLGQNGTGKTTLLRILAGLDHEYTGDIQYGGSPYTSSIGKHMTMVFQKPALLRGTVYKNIEYPLVIRGIPKPDRTARVEEMIQLFRLGALAGKNALTLSGGESQRVALARAFVFRPAILLLDEPTSSIDFDSTERIETLIREYGKRENAVVVMVTHSVDAVNRICDDAVYLRREREGSVHGVFENDERGRGARSDRSASD